MVIVYDNIVRRKEEIKIFDLEFYRKENGKIPVLDFLYSLNPKLRAKAFSDIELLKKLGNELKEPYVKPIKGKNNKGLYELRIKFSSDIARIFYFTYYNNKFVLLYGFIKKTMKTPGREIDKAREYMEDYRRRADS
ncbi:MAG: type II toxin-antitoxin system RelE/ParE family toxin [Blautia sp.]|nr:type II toxin-antitoxin system RelE/ParE family toxin [Lachnoclostridium sp.]MCM1210738.1 type II toxin-antitoxin system RelE/ParE family toxin [Blautia sp.]